MQRPPSASEGSYRLSVDVDLVIFNVTVVDSKGHLVKGLSKENFRIFEDGREEAISLVQPEDVPATVGLVIDNSGSMRRKRSDVVQAALMFAESSNRQDEIFIVNFNERVSMGLPNSLAFTSDINQLRTALTATQTIGKTALYDAIDVALKRLETGTHQKKALVVLSDGGDNASGKSLKDVLAMAQQSSGMIYTIALFDADDKDKNPKVLEQIAKTTGGESYLPRSLDELPDIWQEIASDIRRQYTIGYLSSNPNRDGAFRKVRVSVTDQNGKPLRARSRKGYFGPVQANLGSEIFLREPR